MNPDLYQGTLCLLWDIMAMLAGVVHNLVHLYKCSQQDPMLTIDFKFDFAVY